jgi:hypothetical protein
MSERRAVHRWLMAYKMPALHHGRESKRISNSASCLSSAHGGGDQEQKEPFCPTHVRVRRRENGAPLIMPSWHHHVRSTYLLTDQMFLTWIFSSLQWPIRACETLVRFGVPSSPHLRPLCVRPTLELIILLNTSIHKPISIFGTSGCAGLCNHQPDC